MDERMLKEGMAKVIAYVFQAFLSDDEEVDRLIQMKNNIFPAMRELISYAGVNDPEEMKKRPFVSPYDVLEAGMEKLVKSFYDELRKIFSTESKDKNYAAMQRRIIAWLDHSEMRILEAVKKQLKTDIATKQEVTKIFSNMSELLEKETARLNKYLAEENRQYAKSVIVSNCIKKGYQTYQFVAEGENCEDCNSLSGKTFPLTEAKIGENMAPMHPNCNCRTGVLDEAGNIAFFVEDLRDGKVPDFTRPKTQPQTRTLPQAPQVQKQQAPAQKGDEITELSESEALFIAKLQSIEVPFDKALEILYEMKRTNGKVPEEKFREWGFADKAGIAYVELQYKMIREGMTLEQYDYLESNASLSTATSIAITQLARTAMQKVRQRAIERQINAAKNVDTEAAGEGNNKGTNKANAAKPDVQQGTAEEEANSVNGNYTVPKGGGGVTDNIKIGNKVITFGHGGRHLEGTNLSSSEVNKAIANDVVSKNPGTGQFYKGQVNVNGVNIEYTSYGVEDSVINIGTYYPK